MIPSEKLDEIIEKLDIVEVVSRYVQLKKIRTQSQGNMSISP